MTVDIVATEVMVMAAVKTTNTVVVVVVVKPQNPVVARLILELWLGHFS